MSWPSELRRLNTSEPCVGMHQAEMEDNGSIIRTKTLVEAELDLDIMGLQIGEGRRGINASRSNECRFDAIIRRWEQNRQCSKSQAIFESSSTDLRCNICQRQSRLCMCPKNNRKKEE